MNNNRKLATATEIAQFRFALIAPVIQGLFPDPSRTAYYKRITEKPLTFPDGSIREVSFKTVEKWVSNYQRFGFDSLMPSERSDKGTTRALPDIAIEEIYRLKSAPVHCFIDPEIIVNAPAKYFWAGMGDTMAKHVESVFSSKNDELDFESLYGVTVSDLCYEPILKKGVKAYEDVKNHVVSDEVSDVIKSIIIATGSVSLSVNPDYNSALAHALYYGLTVREWMERKHLHGEIVSYGTLVQLLLDEQYEELRRVYDFNKSVGLPVCLKDLDLEKDDPLDDVLDATIVNQELDHIPYPITKQMVKETILKLEDYK